MQFTINSFRQLFPNKIFLTIPWFSVKSLTFSWQLSNSLTFPGFPDKWSPCFMLSGQRNATYYFTWSYTIRVFYDTYTMLITHKCHKILYFILETNNFNFILLTLFKNDTVSHTAGNVLCNGSHVLSVTMPATGFWGTVKAEYRATAPPWEKPPTTIRLRSIPFFSSSAINDCTVK